MLEVHARATAESAREPVMATILYSLALKFDDGALSNFNIWMHTPSASWNLPLIFRFFLALVICGTGELLLALCTSKLRHGLKAYTTKNLRHTILC